MGRERKSCLLQIFVKIQLLKKKRKVVKLLDRLCRITTYSYNCSCGWIPYRVWRWDRAYTFTAKSVRQREQSPDLMMSSIFTHLWIHSFLSPKPLENTTILPNMGIKWKAGGKAAPKPTFPLHYSTFFGVICNVLVFLLYILQPSLSAALPWCSAFPAHVVFSFVWTSWSYC